MIHHTVLSLVMAIVVCNCSINPQVAANLSEEDKICESVFWYQFDFNFSGLGKTASVYFLSVEGDSDPSLQLLKQFDGHSPQVKPVSASVLEAGTSQVLDRESGLPGIVFRITEIRWLSDEEVEVEGGYEEASESAAGNIYRLEREGGQWKVVESQMLWIK